MCFVAARSAALVVGLLVCRHGFAADSQLPAYVKSFKGKQFILRANEELFGKPSHSGYDGRAIYEFDVAADKDSVKIGDNADWQGKYFVPAPPRTFIVKNSLRRC
jgi:hypothetical protein